MNETSSTDNTMYYVAVGCLLAGFLAGLVIPYICSWCTGCKVTPKHCRKARAGRNGTKQKNKRRKALAEYTDSE